MKNVFLITANIGSLFEGTCDLRKSWLDEIVNTVKSKSPHFFALHLQEIGGKNFRLHSKDTPRFIEELYELLQPDYSSCLALLDLDYNAVEEYTALGSVFFAHESAFDVIQLYRFGKSKFKHLRQNTLHIKQNLRTCKKMRKEKFPRELWPLIRWGRKGYLYTKWEIEGAYLDLINVHLFHDESNLVALQNPLLYSTNRKKAMEFVLDKYAVYCKSDTNPVALLFIFGDFNFRLNSSSLLKKLTKKTTQFTFESDLESPSCSCEDNNLPPCSDSSGFPSRSSSPVKRQLSSVEFRLTDNYLDGAYVLRIEKKIFDFYKPSDFTSSWEKFREDDVEPQAFLLNEAQINFPPTYPWSEDPLDHNSFMSTRPPAWCDRVLMNEPAWNQVSKNSWHTYNSIGQSVCMGDHKPVYLAFSLTSKPT